MAGIANDVKQIRQALYGREVREAIAHGIEQCYSDVTASKTVADTAAAAANTATQNAQTATQQANQARDNAQAVADGVVNQSITSINDAASQQRQSVNDLGDQLKSYMSEHYSETITKAEAKANRSSVSTVKHAIGADGQLTLTDALNEPAKKMMIHLKPKQDLHGYDKPWIGGTGKNLLPSGIGNGNYAGLTWTTNSDGSVTLNGTTTEQIFNKLYFTKDLNLKTGTYRFLLSGASVNARLTFQIANKAETKQLFGTSGSNNTFTVSSDYVGDMVARFIISSGKTFTNETFFPMIITATETDTAYTPYSNICPLDGFDAIEVISTGKNLFKYNVTAVDKTTEYRPNSGQRLIITEESNGDLCFRFNGGGWGAAYLQLNGIDGTKDYALSYSVVSNTTEYVPVMEKDQTLSTKDRLVIWVHASNNGTVVSSSNYFILGNIQFEEGSTATAYEPFGNKTSINLVSSAGSTVYGGTVTVNEDGSGTLVVNRGQHSYDGNQNWRVIEGSDRFYLDGLPSANLLNPSDSSYAEEYKSNQAIYRNTPGQLVYGAYWCFGGSGIYINKLSPDDTIEALKARLGVNPMQISFLLSAPYTYNLTATQLHTLVSMNHIWTDGTSIDLDYYADKYGLVDRLLAAFPKDTATGNQATFADGADDLPVEKLEIAIEPKQDQHGYDRPWAAGAGKNLLDLTSVTTAKTDGGITATPNGDGTFALSGTASTTTANIWFLGTYGASAPTIFTLPAGTYTVYDCVLFKGTAGVVGASTYAAIHAPYKITSSSPIEVSGVRISNLTNGTNYNGVALNPMIIAGEYASGNLPAWEPYSNVCPIEGWDDVEVTRTGKNLLADNGYVPGVLDWDSSNADAMTNNIHFISSPYIKISANTQYTISSFAGNIVRIYVTDENHNKLYFFGNNPTAGTNRIIPATANAHYVRISIGIDDQTVTPSDYGTKVYGQLEAGSTATAYEPYKGQILPVSLKSVTGSSVYGGTLTVNQDGTGTLVADRIYSTLPDCGTIGSSAIAGSSGKYAVFNVSSLPQLKDTLNDINIIFDSMGTVSRANRGAAWYGYVNDQDNIGCFVPSNYTQSQVTEALTGTHFVAKLLTPVTYTLTANQLTTLLGSNHISCDAGEVTVTYHADPTLFITKKIAQAMNA